MDDDEILVRCRLDQLGTSSVTTHEEIRTAGADVVAAAEAVLVVRNGVTRRARPLRDEERLAFLRDD
jgi:acyl-CoA thioesterase FadM